MARGERDWRVPGIKENKGVGEIWELGSRFWMRFLTYSDVYHIIKSAPYMSGTSWKPMTPFPY